MHLDDAQHNDDGPDTPEPQPPMPERGEDNHDDTPANQPDNLIDVLRSGPLETPPDRPRFWHGNPFRRSRPRRDTGPVLFHIHNAADHSLTWTIAGARRFEGRRVAGWQVNFGMLNVQMNDLGRFIARYHANSDSDGRAAWQHTAQQIGVHLYQGLLSVDRLMARQLATVHLRTHPPENLTLFIEGPRDYLSVPYELLHDGVQPLAVQHALCRRITGLGTSRQPFDCFLRDLWHNGDRLHVLLIAADGPRATAEDEIVAVHSTIKQQAARIGLRVAVDTLAGGAARLDAVRVALTQCPYHVVHYAGQVYSDPAAPDASGLLFAGDTPARYGQELLTLHELRGLLHGNTTQFCFISAPIAPQQWDSLTLQDRDYLDVLALLAETGIPYALGLRWYVGAASKRQFAASVYAHLLTRPAIPERAVTRARQQLYARDPQDEIWASPLLLVQTPYQRNDNQQ